MLGQGSPGTCHPHLGNLGCPAPITKLLSAFYAQSKRHVEAAGAVHHQPITMTIVSPGCPASPALLAGLMVTWTHFIHILEEDEHKRDSFSGRDSTKRTPPDDHTQPRKKHCHGHLVTGIRPIPFAASPYQVEATHKRICHKSKAPAKSKRVNKSRRRQPIQGFGGVHGDTFLDDCTLWCSCPSTATMLVNALKRSAAIYKALHWKLQSDKGS